MSHPTETDDTGHALVVTYDPKVSAQVSRLLESAGYAVIVCDDAGHIAERADDSSPAVIVVDAAIAPKGPLDLVHTIRQIPGCNYVPLLLLSDDCSDSTTEQAYDENVTAVVAKPLRRRAWRRRP